MKTALIVLLAVLSLQARAEDSIASAVPVASVSAVPPVSTQEKSKYSATTSINGWLNGSLAAKFKDKSVFVIKVGDDKLDAFVDSVFVAHGIKLAKQEDADVLVSLDDIGISYARDGDQDIYVKYLPIATAPDQAGVYEQLANANPVRGAGGQTWATGSPLEIIAKQVIYRVGSSDAFANATRSKAKTGPFDQSLWVNATLKIKSADGKYKSKNSSFLAKTKDEILRIKKEELFASALGCMIVCSK